MASHTVQQLLARDDFSKRYEKNSPIFFHEFMYPILQGYDSVYLKADVELGGTDQKFNLLLGREMQKQAGQSPQSLMIMPILEGLDGIQKMSKSLDNYIALTDPPNDMFGKTMSISDQHMLRFYTLLSRRGSDYIDHLKNDLEEETLHPMTAKKDIAEEIVSHYWGSEAANSARQNFEEVFSKKKLPDDLQSYEVVIPEDSRINIIELSVNLGFSSSKSEARRILRQNGIKIDDKTMTEEFYTPNSQKECIFKQGKRKIVKILLKES